MTQKKVSSIAAFLRGETTAGLILMGAAALALIVANSPWGGAYTAFLETPVLTKSPLHWINDGLMAVFFLLVGLEIKRAFVGGELSTRAKAALPLLAAAGGMARPCAPLSRHQLESPRQLQRLGHPFGHGYRLCFRCDGAVLTGIGFTMSLLIGNLAFATPENLAEVKIGVLAGSLLSGIAGYLLLRIPINDLPNQIVSYCYAPKALFQRQDYWNFKALDKGAWHCFQRPQPGFL